MGGLYWAGLYWTCITLLIAPTLFLVHMNRTIRKREKEAGIYALVTGGVAMAVVDPVYRSGTKDEGFQSVPEIIYTTPTYIISKVS